MTYPLLCVTFKRSEALVEPPVDGEKKNPTHAVYTPTTWKITPPGNLLMMKWNVEDVPKDELNTMFRETDSAARVYVPLDNIENFTERN